MPSSDIVNGHVRTLDFSTLLVEEGGDRLRGIEERLAATAYLASNTSFFNPVPTSALIEVKLAEQTSADLAEAAKRWGRSTRQNRRRRQRCPRLCLFTAGRCHLLWRPC